MRVITTFQHCKQLHVPLDFYGHQHTSQTVINTHTHIHAYVHQASPLSPDIDNQFHHMMLPSLPGLNWICIWIRSERCITFSSFVLRRHKHEHRQEEKKKKQKDQYPHPHSHHYCSPHPSSYRPCVVRYLWCFSRWNIILFAIVLKKKKSSSSSRSRREGKRSVNTGVIMIMIMMVMVMVMANN